MKMIIEREHIGKRFIGIDPGLANLGHAIVEVTEHGFSLIEHGILMTPPRKSLGVRLTAIYNEIQRLSIECVGAGCESPSFGSTSDAYSLGAAHGVIHLACYDPELPLCRIAPMQLKKFAAGKTQFFGKTDKERTAKSKQAVRDGLADNFGFMFSGTKSDPIDAAGFAVISASYFCGIQYTERHMAEVIAAVRPYTNFN